MDQPLFRDLVKKPKETSSSIGMFFSKLFVYRDKLHFAHLATTSYSEHMALNSAYDGMLGLIDDLVESVQGIYGIQKITQVLCDDYPSTIALVETMYKCIDEYRPLFKESFILNQLDEFQQLFAQTLYKLKFLK